MERAVRELALFNLDTDIKLRGCDRLFASAERLSSV